MIVDEPGVQIFRSAYDVVLLWSVMVSIVCRPYESFGDPTMICTNKRDAKSMVKCKLLSIMMAKDGNHPTSTTDSHTQEHFWESQTFGNGIRGTMCK